MKILLATFWPIPHVGGVWPVMVQLQKRLEAMGHEVDILGNADENPAGDIYLYNQNRRISKEKLLPLLKAKLSVSAYPMLHANPLVNYAEFQRYMFELAAAYFDINRYDLIHTQDVLSTAAIARVRNPRTPMVATLHGCVAHEIRYINHPTNFMAHAYYDAIEHKGATSAEVTHVANQWMKGILMNEFRVEEKQLRVFPYGFDIRSFEKRLEEKTEIARPAGKKVIIFTGRLVELKGVHVLLSALRKVKDKRKDWICWIVGEGEKKDALMQQSEDLDLAGNVSFLGKRSDIPALLRQADIFVLPSLLENQSVSLIEAQIAGKAVIATNAGGLPEMVEEGVTGILVPPWDADRLAGKLERLLQNDDYRHKLGAAAQKWGKDHWSMDRMMGQVLDMYRTAMDQSNKG